MKPSSLSILIPCHNEEKTIARCVGSCLSQSVPAQQIIVVDDGSTDGSVKILEGFGSAIQLIKLEKNTGNKSFVQQIGLRYVTGDFFLSTDADSILDKDFIKFAAAHFLDSKVCAVAGYVISIKHNWLTALREIDYVIGQEIHKTAQSNIGFLFVIPGCAAVFRTEVFKKEINFDHDTLTEDLDFTYKFNSKDHAIVYEKKSITYTQDPADLVSYVRQMRRWYGGGWQNLKKHLRVIKKRPAAAFELSIAYIEGLIFPVAMFLMPVIDLQIYANLVSAYISLTVCQGVYAAAVRRREDLILWSPLYIVIAHINFFIFFEQFVKEIVFQEKDLVWLSPKRH